MLNLPFKQIILAILLICTCLPIANSNSAQDATTPNETDIDDRDTLDIQNEITNTDSLSVIEQNTLIITSELSKLIKNQPFELNINNSLLTLTPIKINEIDMSKYYILDENFKQKSASLDQIYRIDVNVTYSNGKPEVTNIIMNYHSIWFSIEIGEFSIEISPFGNDSTKSEFSKVHKIIFTARKDNSVNNEMACQSYGAMGNDRGEKLVTATTYYPDLVLAGSVSFYNAYGSNWAAELENIFDSSGSEDLYSMYYEEINVNWNLRRVFAFTSGGPSSYSARNFLIEYDTFVNGLPDGDPIFPFHSSAIVSGHEFTSWGVGYAWVNEYQKIEEPQDLDYHDPFAVVQAYPTNTMRLKKFILTHEISHILGGSHSDSTTINSYCWKPWSWRHVTIYSLMAGTYYGSYRCIDGSAATDFYWSTTNENEIESTAVQHT